MGPTPQDAPSVHETCEQSDDRFQARLEALIRLGARFQQLPSRLRIRHEGALPLFQAQHAGRPIEADAIAASGSAEGEPPDEPTGISILALQEPSLHGLQPLFGRDQKFGEIHEPLGRFQLLRIHGEWRTSQERRAGSVFGFSFFGFLTSFR